MREMKLTKINEEAYKDYLSDKAGMSMQMQMPMINIFKSRGWECFPVGLYADQDLVGVAMISGKPIKIAGMMYTCQYGPYLDSYDNELVEAFFTQVLDVIKAANGAKFICNPNVFSTKYDLSGEPVEKYQILDEAVITKIGYTKKDLSIDTNGQMDMRFVYKKDIPFTTEDELLKSYTASTRRDVLNAEKSCIEINEVQEDELKAFTKLMGMSGEKHGYRVHGIEYYKQVKKEYKDDALMLIAKIDCNRYISEKTAELNENLELIESYGGNNRKGRITKLEEQNSKLTKLMDAITESKQDILYLTAGVYIKTNDELIHFLSGNDNEYSRFCSSALMQHTAMKFALDNGLQVFNMYGVSGTFEKSDSVFKFKTGFGGYVQEYIGTYTYELKPTKIKIANSVKKMLGR